MPKLRLRRKLRLKLRLKIRISLARLGTKLENVDLVIGVNGNTRAKGENLQAPPRRESQNPTMGKHHFVNCGLTIHAILETSVGSNMRDQELARRGA